MVIRDGATSQRVQDGKGDDDFAGFSTEPEKTTTSRSGVVTDDQSLLAAFGYAFVMYYI